MNKTKRILMAEQIERAANDELKKTIKLSDDVIKICKENYSKKCDICELRQKCVSHVGTGHHCLNKWILSVNKLGETINKKIGEI